MSISTRLLLVVPIVISIAGALVFNVTRTMGGNEISVEGGSTSAASMHRDWDEYDLGSRLEPAPSPKPEPEPEMLEALGYLSESAPAEASFDVPEAAAAIPAGTEPPPILGRYLIKNATVSAKVEDVAAVTEALTDQVRLLGGFVASLNEQNDGEEVRQAYLTLRVPVENLEEALAGVEGQGRIIQCSVNTQDVTETYVDVEARLRNIGRTEERLLGHLDAAGELKDILLAEKELTRVREQSERLMAQMRSLKDRIAFSTVQVTLYAQTVDAPVDSAPGLGEVFGFAVAALSEFFRSLLAVSIWMAVWSVVWVPLALAVWWLYRKSLPQSGSGQARSTVREAERAKEE